MELRVARALPAGGRVEAATAGAGPGAGPEGRDGDSGSGPGRRGSQRLAGPRYQSSPAPTPQLPEPLRPSRAYFKMP